MATPTGVVRNDSPHVGVVMIPSCYVFPSIASDMGVLDNVSVVHWIRLGRTRVHFGAVVELNVVCIVNQNDIRYLISTTPFEQNLLLHIGSDSAGPVFTLAL
jgi:hypothetical protein